MKPITANLKHLYQSRTIWLFNFMLLIGISVLIAGLFIPGISLQGLAPFYIITGVFGGGIGIIVTDVWNKPFSYCLPGQIKTVQKTLALVWFSLLIISSVIMIGLALRIPGSGIPLILAWVGFTSLSYWFGVSYGLGYKKSGLRALFLFMIIIFAPHVFKPINSVIATYPWITALIAGLLSYLLYRYVNRRDHVRLVCGNPLYGAFDIYDEEQQKRLIQARMRLYQDQRPDRMGEFIGNFFSGRIRQNNKSLPFAHMWGQAYIVMGRVIPGWPVPIFAIILFFFLCSFTQLKGVELYMLHVMLFVMAGFIGSMICVSPRLNHFLLTGRRLHFFRGIVLLFTALLTVIVFMGISVLLYNGLSAIIPAFTLLNWSFEIVPVRWKILVLPLMITPFFGGIIILLKEWGPFIRGITLGFMTVAIIILTGYIMIKLESTSFIFSLMNILLISFLTWLFHLAMLYYESMKKSLCS
jgi:hypothetical protein